MRPKCRPRARRASRPSRHDSGALRVLEGHGCAGGAGEGGRTRGTHSAPGGHPTHETAYETPIDIRWDFAMDGGGSHLVVQEECPARMTEDSVRGETEE